MTDDLVTGAILFIVALALLLLAANLLSRRMRQSDVNTLDRSLGFAFGLLRGAFVLSAGYLLLDHLLPVREQPEWLRQASLMVYVAEGATFLTWLAPERIARARETVDETSERAAKQITEPSAPIVVPGQRR